MNLRSTLRVKVSGFKLIKLDMVGEYGSMIDERLGAKIEALQDTFSKRESGERREQMPEQIKNLKTFNR